MDKKVVRKLNKKRILITVIGFIIVIILVLIFILGFSLCAVDKNGESKKFVIEKGTYSNTVVENLEKEKLIKSATAFKIYMKLFGTLDFEAGTYMVSPKQNSMEIYNSFKNNKFSVNDGKLITFKEGINMTDVINTIVNNTDLTKNDIETKLKDEKYLDSLINEYWFLTKEIKNKNIYYPLEGYLFPDTYSIKSDSSVETIFKMMLDRENTELSKYKKEINNSKYSVHELLSLASVVELEGNSSVDRAKIAGVFYNRLDKTIPLGSDITTYYAVSKVVGKDELTNSDINTENPYNTRTSSMAGKMPVGPICNPGSDAIKGVLYPTKTNYYYFVSDTSGKIYYTKTIDEHNALINKLTKEGKW